MHLHLQTSSRMALVARNLDYNPPPARNWVDDNPTLLVSWWMTLFSLTIILFRLAGRWIRTERLFLEDKIMALSIIPLMIRMGFAHMVLRNGTNNAVTLGLSPQDIVNREFGSRMVLGARIFYAMFLWIAKLTVTEFLHRLCGTMWKRSWTLILNAIRGFLALTYVGVVISTLAECQPFDHYWQVVPDPGSQCRQAYVQLFTMGVADIVTDLVLVAFPVYIMFQSNMKLMRKLSLSCLFGLSLILVGVTCYRLTGTTQRASSQPFRSLMASVEILTATFVSNALVLGSFMRDRGVKKAKFNRSYGSVNGNGMGGHESVLDRPGSRPRPRGVQSWGSDHDLVGDIGIRVEDHDEPRRPARPAPVAVPASSSRVYQAMDDDDENFSPRDTSGMARNASIDLNANRQSSRRRSDRRDSVMSSDSEEEHYEPTLLPKPPAANSEPNPRRMSFFDVGGLLDDPPFPLAVTKRSSIGSSAVASGKRSSGIRIGSGGRARDRDSSGATGRQRDSSGASGMRSGSDPRRASSHTAQTPSSGGDARPPSFSFSPLAALAMRRSSRQSQNMSYNPSPQRHEPSTDEPAGGANEGLALDDLR